jgi:hypothetical protein
MQRQGLRAKARQEIQGHHKLESLAASGWQHIASRYRAQHPITTHNVYYVKLTLCSQHLITSGYAQRQRVYNMPLER